MGKWISGAACAAAVLSMTLAAAETPAQATAKAEQSNSQKNNQKSNRGRVPDRPSTLSDAAQARQEATLTGCVVRDAANGGQATIASNGISYRLTGRPAKDFDQYLGKRVEVTGLLDSGSTGARATSGNTETRESAPPKDLTAVGGQSDVTATGTPRDNTAPPATGTTPNAELPLATDRGTTADLTGRVQVKTLRIVSPSCL